MTKWEYVVVLVQNNGRTILENGEIIARHTKKKDGSALPRNMWNSKGAKMATEAKGELLNYYGSKGWELVSTQEINEVGEGQYFFKRIIKAKTGKK